MFKPLPQTLQVKNPVQLNEGRWSIDNRFTSTVVFDLDGEFKPDSVVISTTIVEIEDIFYVPKYTIVASGGWPQLPKTQYETIKIKSMVLRDNDKWPHLRLAECVVVEDLAGEYAPGTKIIIDGYTPGNDDDSFSVYRNSIIAKDTNV